ncbi:hypothetical protein FEI17_26895 (plasmid) [Kosakonia radicincitans]|uniref:hypothetical protein n=1 Tax=Kosakonia radicincitans TaxID=283686 RepID=UPI0011EFCA09|nr:hypothetical protein [Kosakonia radicincitans]QEM94267.1 hypothetical protein FEI17_26895 [Kosakonia radicincitans]
MGRIKQSAEKLATGLLRRAGVPEAQLHNRMRRAGQVLFLLSIPFIIPLIILDHASLGVTVLLQTVYGVLVCLGVLLAFDEQEKIRR